MLQRCNATRRASATAQVTGKQHTQDTVHVLVQGMVQETCGRKVGPTALELSLNGSSPVSYTHLRAHETSAHL
eukprot:5122691-Alexandrium_andersonii.AAC.1